MENPNINEALQADGPRLRKKIGAIIAVVLVIAAAISGYIIYNHFSGNDGSLEPKTDSDKNPDQIDETDIPAGWKAFRHSVLGIILPLPGVLGGASNSTDQLYYRALVSGG